MTAFHPWEHLKVEHNYTGSTWFDFTLDLTKAQIVLREFTGKHTATLSFYNDDMDPSQGSGDQVIHKGDKVRISAKNSSGTFRKMGTFRVAKDGVTVAIDLTKPAGRQNLVTVNLEGVGVTGVGGSPGGSGVATLHELSNTIDGAAFEINGEGDGSGITAPDDDFTEISDNDAATELDQIVLTRDSRPGSIVFEDPEGVLQIFNSATHQTAAAALTVGPSNYSHIDMTFDDSHVINVLKIKKVSKVKAGKHGSVVAVIEAKYKDDASITKYGKCRKVLTIHGRADLDDYAAEVFDRNADPDPVPTSVTIPIRKASELLGGYEDGVFVSKKITVQIPDGTTYACRVKRLQHNIGAKLWTVTIFLRGQDVMQSPREEKSSALGGGAGTEIGNNPDGSIEKEKLAFRLNEGMVDTHTVVTPGDQTIHLTYQPTVKTEHLLWNGQSQPYDAIDRTDWTVTVEDPDGFLAVDDELQVQYLFTDDTTEPPVPASLTLVGSTHRTTSGNLTLPGGTVAGDLIVVAIADKDISTPTTSPDARLTTHYNDTVNPGSPTFLGYLGCGYEDGSGSAVAVTLTGGWAMLSVFRITGAVEIVHTAVTGVPVVPVMPSPDADMGIVALIGVNGVGGDPNFADDTGGDWTTVSPATHSGGTSNQGRALMAYCTTGTPDGTWPPLNSNARWAALVVGITDEVFTP